MEAGSLARAYPAPCALLPAALGSSGALHAIGVTTPILALESVALESFVGWTLRARRAVRRGG